MSAASLAEPFRAVPPSDVAPAAGRSRLLGGPRAAALWAGALGLAFGVHAAIGLAWLARPLPASVGAQSAEPAFELDLAESPTGPATPAIDAAPDVPLPEVEPAATAEVPASPPAETAPPPLPDLSNAPVLMAPGPPPPVRTDPDRWVAARSDERLKARQRAEAMRGRMEQARDRAEHARRRAAAMTQQSPGRGPASSSAAAPSGAAVAAASAAWRSQIVGILRGRFAGGAGGMASVTFSVTRAGQIGGARLTASSGDPHLDGAAMAAFRGAVPAPPSGYVGPLTFNIRLGVR